MEIRAASEMVPHQWKPPIVPDTTDVATTQSIEVSAVATKSDIADFVSLPKRLYAGYKGFIAPLDMERREAIDATRNPYFKHARVRMFLARQGGRPVGRISAQICELYQAKHDKYTGHFGYLDAENDPAVFQALLRTAESWLKGQGLNRVLGPFSLSTNEECGQLVDGFDSQPMLMMPYHPPYAGPLIESCGYQKAKDLLAYVVDEETYRSVGSSRIIEKMRQEERIRLRQVDMKNLQRDLSLILEIFNDAWADNWGMVPFSQAEIEAAAKAMKPLIDPNLVVIGEVDGEAAGMLVCLPNLLEAIRDLDGKLLPFGWLKLLLRLKGRSLKTARIPLMGIRKKHQSTLIGATLLPLMFDQLKRPFLARGLKSVELSWILEDNKPMRRVLEGIGAKVYKTYRIYEKSLA